MKVGKNTRQSVLDYIDAVWDKNQPPDPIALAVELGFSLKAIRGLEAKHGDGLLAHLTKIKRERTERLRYPAKQNGLLHPQQYATSPWGAVDVAAAVDNATQSRFADEVQGDNMELRRRKRLPEPDALKREHRSLETRLGIARKVAEIRQVDISPHVRRMERDLHKIEKLLADGDAQEAA